MTGNVLERKKIKKNCGPTLGLVKTCSLKSELRKFGGTTNYYEFALLANTKPNARLNLTNFV